MLVGDSTAKQICFQASTFDDSLLPADLDSAATLPPSGQSEVFLGSIDNGTPNVYQYLFHVGFHDSLELHLHRWRRNHADTWCGLVQFGLRWFQRVHPATAASSDLLDSLGDRLMYGWLTATSARTTKPG